MHYENEDGVHQVVKQPCFFAFMRSRKSSVYYKCYQVFKELIQNFTALEHITVVTDREIAMFS